MFDFQVERRVPEIHNAYIDYQGNICVEYEEYLNMGGIQIREIEFTSAELRKLLEIAEEQENLYGDFQKSCFVE